MFGFIWKIPALYICNILLHGSGYLLMHIQVPSQEPGFEFSIDAQHIMHYKNLAVAVRPCADPDRGYMQAFADLFGQGCRNLFQYKRKAARLL